jgi:D-xylose transport system permease protein
MKLKTEVRTYAMVAALAGIWIAFYLLEPKFLAARNLSNLARQMSETAILAIGMVFVIVSGNVDLSVGSLAGLTGGIAAMINAWGNQSSFISMAGALAIGLLAGAIQGAITAYRRIPAFIVTLGGLMAFRGALWAATRSIDIPLNAGFFKNVGKDYLPQMLGWVLAAAAVFVIVGPALKRSLSAQKSNTQSSYEQASLSNAIIASALIVAFIAVMNSYEGVSYPVLIMLALALALHLVSRRTRFGRHVYAIGGNAEAARLSGINVRKNLLAVFMMMGFLSAVAGVIMTSRLACSSSTTGQLMELNAIAACVIGGCSLMGGRGKISGAILGALIMASLDNGLSLKSVDIAYQYIIKGFALVAAVSIDVATKKTRT